MRLFAYGTLKDLELLASVVGPHVRSRVVGCGTVVGQLYDVGAYPALRPSDSPDDRVPGVLLEIDGDVALARLDDFEDVAGGVYARERCEVRMDDGRRESAWVYVYTLSVAGRRRIAAWPLTERRASLSVRSTQEEHAMVEKSIELTGTSANSIEDAVNLAVSRAAVTIEGIRRVEIAGVSATVEKGSVASWHVTMKVTFTIQDRLHE